MQRRSFVKNISLATAGFLLACNTPVAALAGNLKRVKGAVSSNGKGLANVVVSDGYTVLETDRRGRFEFDVNPDAVNLFISTPSGYEFLQDRNITRHYKKLDGQVGEFNFELTPLVVSDDEHEFFILADTQVKNKKDVEMLMRHTVPDIQEQVRQRAGKLVHGITVGDVVWDDLEYFDDYSHAVNEMGIPFFQVLGNHDMDFNNGGEATSDDTFMERFGPTYYSFNRGKVHYVVMDNVRYLGVSNKYDGYILEHQLEWLKKDLYYVPYDRLIVLCMHIPVFDHTINRDALLALLQDRDVHIMTGHTHLNKNIVQGRIYEHNHGTVCGAWWTGDICGDGTPNGYAVYEVKGNNISWKYKSTGKDIAYQMSLTFTPDGNGGNLLQANIWNYDPSWKTELIADGISLGPLEQYEGFDPDAYRTMLGPNLPAYRGFPEPNLTRHLFKANIPANTYEVKVLATDRFGNVFESVRKLKAGKKRAAA